MFKGLSRILTLYTVDRSNSRILPYTYNVRIRKINNGYVGYVFKRTSHNNKGNTSPLLVPLPVPPDENLKVGEEFTGHLKKQKVLNILNKFYQKPEIKVVASQNGLEGPVLYQAFLSFRKHCLQHDLSPDLHIIISDIIAGAGHHDDLFPYFLRHARLAFPHLNCLEDLKKISDLRCPANWYPQARHINRKIIFHAGPTNSGKTYHALKKFLSANSGVYCGPLKLLAAEIYHKSNSEGTPCDLITGEDRRHASQFETTENEEDVLKKPQFTSTLSEQPSPSKHIACTVEMASLNDIYDVAIIDEIQMIGDRSRGWAWTRAVLGLQAREIHLCGEAGAINLIEELCNTTAEELEVREYNRLSPLKVENNALSNLSMVQPGDCIVCFNKADIYNVCRSIERSGHEVAVIYGSLPPATKLAQAKKFNDPECSCKVMVATDAVGLGINLNIRRIIFYSLMKPSHNEDGEIQKGIISVSQALQIAGRAGRYGNQWGGGWVTTFKSEDLVTLKNLMAQQPEPVMKAGLYPTAEQMELYGYHLPHATLSNLVDIFVHLCTVDDSLYMICNVQAFKFLAEQIQHIVLPLRVRYLYCCAPVNIQFPFLNATFQKIARRHSTNEPITKQWVCKQVDWPLPPARSIADLVHLEIVFHVLDLYIWLSFRFPDMFPDAHLVREMSAELEVLIQQGVFKITRLTIESSESEINVDDNSSELNVKEETPTKIAKLGGKLSDKLIAKGLITPDMLRKLQKELVNKSEMKEPNRTRQGRARSTRTRRRSADDRQ